MFDVAAFRLHLESMTDDEVCAAFDEVAAARRTSEAIEALIAGEVERRELHKRDGCITLEGWITQRLNVRATTARRSAKVARALRDLPVLAATMAEGRLSHDQMVPLVSFATPENEAMWAERAQGWTPNYLQRIADHKERIAASEANARRAEQGIWFMPSGVPGVVKLRGRLADVDAETVMAGLDLMADRIGPNGDGIWEPQSVRRADALVALVGGALGDAQKTDPSLPKAWVHIHASVEAVDTGDGWATLGDGTSIAPATLNRYLCDCKWNAVAENIDGIGLGIGRASQSIPGWMAPQILNRDMRRCRFKGCDRTAKHLHHMRHWTRGGPTDADNLIAVCWFHHRLLHEGGWNATGNANLPDGVRFHPPNGPPLPLGLPPSDPDHRRRTYGVEAA